MKWLLPPIAIYLLAVCSACKPQAGAPTARSSFLDDARKNFHTTLTRQEHDGAPPPEPPKELFRLVHYPSAVGPLAAYVTPSPVDGKRHPAVIWIASGVGNGIGALPWTPQPPENDQSASAFWKAGLVTMYPSFRGGNDNPGFNEGYFGEVDDVLAAAAWLAGLDCVAPDRIYLGGHSTGGTLALLAAECTDRFRAVFCFGPSDDVAAYGRARLPFDLSIPTEHVLRTPGRWLESIRKPTFVFEGDGRRANLAGFLTLTRTPHPETLKMFSVRNADHFSELAPMTRLIAAKIQADTGNSTNIGFTDQEMREIVGAPPARP